MLSSALFWRILLSSLLVVGILALGLYRASSAHQELEQKFDRLVQHDLKLADDAEVLLRMTSDLETGKRGFLLTGDRSFLMPYDQARNDLESVLTEAQATAENGKEDERVAAFGRLVNDWIRSVSEPQIAARERGEAVESEQVALGKVRTDEMRAILTELRNDAIKDAREQQSTAFQSVERSRRETTGILLVAIVLALASGIWIARDLAGATGRLEEALEATGKLEPLPALPDRRDELGAVNRSLVKMAALLHDKDGSLRRTLAEREATLEDLTRANAELAARDEEGRAYNEFVRELKTLDVGALSTSGLRGLVRLAGAHVGAVFLVDSADRLVPVHAASVDGRALDTGLFGSKGLPQSVMETRELTVLGPTALGDQAPELDLGVGKVKIGWVLGQPIAVGDEGAGAVILGRTTAPSNDREQLVRDAARQFAAGLHNAWTHARLREKTNILAEQGETLTRANRVKTEFLASMSHELRTPLNAIIGFADLLLASQREELSPRARESLERIRRNGTHLLSLINDVLDLAKAESGRIDVRVGPVDVSQLTRACVAEVDSLRQGKSIELLVDAPPTLDATTDSQRLRQILLNLLANAIKFTEQGHVKVTVTSEGAEMRIAVNDTGLGIPEHLMPELFREFRQLETGDGKRYAGTGIGLALSRRLARALGGEIEVVSAVGKGSTFTIVLPRVRRETQSTITVTA
ncbi:MAG TPA: ATP-binding protein [Polyangiaceae bacterium]|jgi:signal transduction histidine kinase/CHASE3 domain sensor protein|nr:ATP-binding protein [Polyangiaceae bacterium]